MRPRPLLLVSNHAEIVGGGEISLLALLEGLDRSRWAPTLVVPGEGAVAARCRSLGIPVRAVPLPSLRRPGWAAPRSVFALRGLARGSGARLVHANGSRAMLYAGPACRLAGIPAIWHVRIADRDGPLDRLLAGLARAVIVNSRAVGRRFDWALPGKVRCIHNGVDTARFAPRPAPQGLRASLGLPEGAPVVASVGRFVAFKGYATLLEAAHLVRAAAPDAHWLVVGDGELRGDLEARRRALELEGCVWFTGWREDVPDLLALCDLFVLPSLGEHFGRVLIEAMAMARPVVATDAGGVPEIVIAEETGLLVPPGNPKALAEAVLALLADPARARDLGAAGRRRAEACFSLRRHVEAVEAVYRELGGGEA
jgi:glycosyltransferase involved in cell wall biosynthesis